MQTDLVFTYHLDEFKFNTAIKSSCRKTELKESFVSSVVTMAFFDIMKYIFENRLQ